MIPVDRCQTAWVDAKRRFYTTLPITMDTDKVCKTVKEEIPYGESRRRLLFEGEHNLPGDLPETHIEAMLQVYRDCRDGADCLANSSHEKETGKDEDQ
jgi:hypothetical protein